MFISKISGLEIKKNTFKGYQHEINSAGAKVLRFNYPFDYKNKECEVEIYKVVDDSTKIGGYRVVEESPILTKKIDKNGTIIDLNSETKLEKDAPFAYRFKINGESRRDTGLQYRTYDKYGNATNTDFTIVSRVGTTPMVQGAGVLTMSDMHKPGAQYYPFGHIKAGKIDYDENRQKQAENIVKTYSNKIGGTLAGIEDDIPKLKEMGVKVLFATPIVGADNVMAHHYHNKNNFQISNDVGNLENIHSFAKSLFKNGIVFVNDGTLTSEGLEGIHVQYALRWADKNPQFMHWLRMDGLRNRALAFGVVPAKIENFTHRVINPPVIYNEKTNSVVKNEHYDANKETYFQTYDASQVSEAQEAKLDKVIDHYKKAMGGNDLEINTYEDTVINYVLEVDPRDYEKSLQAFADHNKGLKEKIKPTSPDGTLLIARFPNFSLAVNSSGIVEWDSNKGLLAMGYHTAGYDEKINQAFVIEGERVREQELRRIGATEVQDMNIQVGRYWTRIFNDADTLYVAQALKGANTSEAIGKLIEKGILPAEAYIDNESIANAKLDLFAMLPPRGVLEKNDVTIKSMTRLPLSALDVAEKTAGVLSTSYFTNYATSEKQLGKTRFELMQEDNPHLLPEYAENYKKVNGFFENELRFFAHDVINKIDVNSQEKLLETNGNYTEFGERVMDLYGQQIARFALLRAIAGDKLKYGVDANGSITYDYQALKNDTTLKSLGINASNPREEAIMLRKLIARGLDKLEAKDVKFLADAIGKQISGMTSDDLLLAELIVKVAGLGLAWRADAAKDIVHMDSTRNNDTSFDQNWQSMLNFWARFVQAVKAENPSSYIVAEITDVDKLIKRVAGQRADIHDRVNPGMERKLFKNVQDAIIQFFNKTGMTSEAAYSYTFTNLLMTFSAEFESGSSLADDPERPKKFYDTLTGLLNNRGLDYIRNLYTFSDNHDKPSVIHGMALDMGLFHHPMSIYDVGSAKVDFDKNRWVREDAMKAYTNSDSWEEMPLEAKLNMDNPEYFMNMSTKAVAMHKHMREAINEALGSTVDENTKKYLKQALTDLTNGSLFGTGQNLNAMTMNIKALSSFEEALKEILSNAKIELSQDEFNKVMEIAYSREVIDRHTVRGDFNWDDKEKYPYGDTTYGKYNRDTADWILKGANQDKASGEKDYMKYSLYTLSFAAILSEAFEKVLPDQKLQFLDGAKAFFQKYDRATVEAGRTNKPFIKTPTQNARSNGFATRDFERVIKMMIDQAEYRAKEDGYLDKENHFENSNDILVNMFRYTTEPAVQKALMYGAALSGIPGICVTFLRDMLGALGYEEKTKNLYLQDRNAIPWSQLKEGPLKEYRTDILKRFTEVIQMRSADGAEPINNGTPYALSTSNDLVKAFMFQDGYGQIAFSVFNFIDVNPAHKFDYHQKYGITDEASRKKFFAENDIDSINPLNKFVPIQRKLEINYIDLGDNYSLAEDTEFVNINQDDQATYVVRKLDNGHYGICNKDALTIALNGTTAKNGVMLLVEKISKRPLFKQIKTSIASNLYKAKEKAVVGKVLSNIKV